MNKTCFIISSIGSEGSDTRTKSNEKLDFLFKPVLDELNYKCIRADGEDIPGSISRQIIQRLIDSEMVIADISDNNPNVFYELAVRNAVNKPLIVIKSPQQKPPFDILDTRAIDVDMTVPRIWQKAKEKLKKQIVAAEKDQKQASLSILSDFTGTMELQTKDDIQSEVLRRVKDLEDSIKRKPKPTPMLNYLVICKKCRDPIETSNKNTKIIQHQSKFIINEFCNQCGELNTFSDKDMFPKGR